MQHHKKEQKEFYDNEIEFWEKKDSQFWDRLVKGLFISGLAIILFAVLLKWLEFF